MLPLQSVPHLPSRVGLDAEEVCHPMEECKRFLRHVLHLEEEELLPREELQKLGYVDVVDADYQSEANLPAELCRLRAVLEGVLVGTLVERVFLQTVVELDDELRHLSVEVASRVFSHAGRPLPRVVPVPETTTPEVVGIESLARLPHQQDELCPRDYVGYGGRRRAEVVAVKDKVGVPESRLAPVHAEQLRAFLREMSHLSEVHEVAEHI